MRKKSDEKNPKSCTLLKRQKISFLGRKFSPLRNRPYIPPDLNIGGFLIGILLICSLGWQYLLTAVVVSHDCGTASLGSLSFNRFCYACDTRIMGSPFFCMHSMRIVGSPKGDCSVANTLLLLTACALRGLLREAHHHRNPELFHYQWRLGRHEHSIGHSPYYFCGILSD